MNGWFTIEKIDYKTFVISEYQHWEQVHSYLIIGSNKAILLDTGLGVANIKDVVDKLTTLPIHVITTHAHWDHIGSHSSFNEISVHYFEKEWLEGKFPLPLEVVKSNLMCKECKFPDTFNINEYDIPNIDKVEALKDGDVISLGDRELEVIHTPGHSPGHICLYDAKMRYLFSGDLIYEGKLDMFYPTTNPMDFMKSIQKVAKLQVERILPAHYSLEVNNDMIGKIQYALEGLYQETKLVQGYGIVEYDGFSIQL